MDELLKAMQRGDQELVDKLACELFITKNGELNKAQVNEFEWYAPCLIRPGHLDNMGWLRRGRINYYDKSFYFG